MFCPANWRQSPEELAFVIDDLDAKVVVWQEAEIGDGVRAARELAGIGRPVDPPRHRRDEGTRRSSPAARATTDSDRVVDPSETPLLDLHGRVQPGARTRRCSRTARCIAQGLVYGHYTGTTADDVYLNTGPLFHLATLMHTLATFVAGGTNVFVPRVDAELLCRHDRRRTLHRRVPRRADVRRRSSRSTPDAATTCRACAACPVAPSGT